MRSRLETLKRLRSLYGDVEEMHSMELQRTTASVREAEQAIDMQREVMRSSGMDARSALAYGDSVGWATARTQREIAEWKQQRLQEVRLEREMLNSEATRRYLASRMQSEQMKHVADNTAAQAAMESGRRTQSGLDDRFLARRRWTDKQEAFDDRPR